MHTLRYGSRKAGQAERCVHCDEALTAGTVYRSVCAIDGDGCAAPTRLFCSHACYGRWNPALFAGYGMAENRAGDAPVHAELARPDVKLQVMLTPTTLVVTIG